MGKWIRTTWRLFSCPTIMQYEAYFNIEAVCVCVCLSFENINFNVCNKPTLVFLKIFKQHPGYFVSTWEKSSKTHTSWKALLH